ncbi:MAG: trypsin-like peptidase domain-containing protein [Clostridia bacterium]|nr:trypsin-like peptidase domain-containing protein [Clostridia bacterium]
MDELNEGARIPDSQATEMEKKNEVTEVVTEQETNTAETKTETAVTDASSSEEIITQEVTTEVPEEVSGEVSGETADDSEAIRKTALIESEVKKTERHKRLITAITAAIIVIGLLAVIGMQTVYIYKLSTARIGIMTYENSSYREEKEEKDDSEEKEEKELIEAERKDVVDPLFNLEEAASVTDPNKKTLKTWEIANEVMPATVSIYIVQDYSGSEVTLASGSGFVITENGYVVTNKHVIADAISDRQLKIAVRVPGITEAFTAKIVGSDEQTDIAVIKLNTSEKLKCVVLGDSDTLQVGELAVAIGNPLGSFESTVTVGVISANSREMNTNGYSINLLQTDASINSGNSGGPLINSFGEVIGVTNAKITSAEGLGFAIPINTIKGIIESIIQYGYVANRPTLGVSIQTVVESSYFGANAGFYVASLVEGGPGEQAGLQIGDRIVTFDGVEITSTNDIISIRDAHNVGDSIKIEVERDEEIVEVILVIGDSADYED